MARGELATVTPLPNIKVNRGVLLGKEIGTGFDYNERLYASWGGGDVFDYGEWTAREMNQMLRRDGQASAIELVLTLPIREADRSIEGAKGDKGETDLVRGNLMASQYEGGIMTPFDRVVGQITTGQIFRKAFFETTWQLRESDGKLVYTDIASRPAATCQLKRNERNGRPDGFRQNVWQFGNNVRLARGQKVPGYVEIPRLRSYVYIHGQHREPMTGVSEMDVAYWCYQTKMKLLFLWYQYLENTALPRTIVYGPDQPTANDRAYKLASMKSSGVMGMVHPGENQKAFETLGTGGDEGSVYREALSFLESWQIGSVLAGFMGLTGAATGGRGSYALSQDQSSFYLKSRQAVAREIEASINHDLIAPMVLYNFGPHAAFPSFKFGPLQDEQIQALLTLFGQIVAAPALHIPIEFVDLLAERMASVLQLDVDAVHSALVSSAKQRAAQLNATAPPGMPPGAAQSVGALAGLANSATSITRQVAMQRGGLPRPMPGPATAGGPPAKPPMTPPPGRMA